MANSRLGLGGFARRSITEIETKTFSLNSILQKQGMLETSELNAILKATELTSLSLNAFLILTTEGLTFTKGFNSLISDSKGFVSDINPTIGFSSELD